MILSKLGPFPASDSKFMRRIRVHQAWYRSSVLGLRQYGHLAGSHAPCGSVLPDKAADHFLNFNSRAAILHYELRRAMGWGVEPIRCKSYMTSSQALTFNMFGPVVGNASASAALFNALLGRSDLVQLEWFNFEYCAFGTEFTLGDRTHVDLILRFSTTAREVQIVAVEAKLGDRFSTRRTVGMLGPGYRELAISSGLWHSLYNSLTDNRTRQLTRCHALAESLQRSADPSGKRAAILAVLLHPSDTSGSGCFEAYERMVRRSDSIAKCSWDEYLACAMQADALDLSAGRILWNRYVDLQASQDCWLQHNRVNEIR